MPQPLVTVIIPTWRRYDLLRACLQSLAEQTEQRFRVVVVSNGAGPEAAAEAASFGKGHDCQLLTLPANRGFAAGVNAGLEVAQTKYIAVLNDDVRLHPEWLATLTRWMEAHAEAGFCAGAILSDDGQRIDNLGDAVARSGAGWRLGFGLASDAAQGTEPRPLLAATWTAVLLRDEALRRVGKLDENFISYLEDIDFAVRCVAAGVRGFLVPEAQCRHRGGGSTAGNSSLVFKLMTRNQRLLVAKDFPAEIQSENRAHIRRAQRTWLMMALRQGRSWAWFAGILSYFRALPEATRNRLHWDPEAVERLRRWLEAGEQAIYADQFAPQRKGPDTYWRWYFASRSPEPAAGAVEGSRTVSRSSSPRSWPRS